LSHEARSPGGVQAQGIGKIRQHAHFLVPIGASPSGGRASTLVGGMAWTFHPSPESHPVDTCQPAVSHLIPSALQYFVLKIHREECEMAYTLLIAAAISIRLDP
ncbi:MAG: hypothetical protein ABEI52_11420, partial [Halobacteriaceae archaeon]